MVDGSVEDYYNSHVDGKLKGFTEKNLRIENAWKTVSQYAPKNPKKILEVGCGIGDTCHRMSKKWKNAIVTGIDISTKSIEIADKLFASNKIQFKKTLFTKETFKSGFDLILLMDVYEHIKDTDRPVFHEAIKEFLNPNGVLILTCPTPQYLSYLRKYVDGGIQPVDEDINVTVIQQLAKDTNTEITLYKEVNIWHPGDYVHIVLCKTRPEWTKDSFASNTKQRSGVEKILSLVLNNPLISRKSFRTTFVKSKLKS